MGRYVGPRCARWHVGDFGVRYRTGHGWRCNRWGCWRPEGLAVGIRNIFASKKTKERTSEEHSHGDKVIHTHNSIADAIAELTASSKFLAWKPEPKPERPLDLSRLEQNAAETHYTPQELADIWRVSVDSIRRIFRDEPGVLKMGEKNPKHKRQYLTLRIPESVVLQESILWLANSHAEDSLQQSL